MSDKGQQGIEMADLNKARCRRIYSPKGTELQSADLHEIGTSLGVKLAFLGWGGAPSQCKEEDFDRRLSKVGNSAMLVGIPIDDEATYNKLRACRRSEEVKALFDKNSSLPWFDLRVAKFDYDLEIGSRSKAVQQRFEKTYSPEEVKLARAARAKYSLMIRDGRGVSRKLMLAFAEAICQRVQGTITKCFNS